MTDPNVTKVLRNIVEALVVLAPSGSILPGVQAARRMIDEADALLAAAEKPAEQTDGPIGIALGGALMFPPVVDDKPAAAPTVAAVARVEFDADGIARGAGWSADLDRNDEGVYVDLRLYFLPGEDAGETLAKALAACGRGP